MDICTITYWKEVFISQFLLFCFIFAVTIGLLWPEPGTYVSSFTIGDVRVLQSINVITVFAVSGLTLQLSDLKSAFSNWIAILYGLVLILCITPLFGFATMNLPFDTSEFSVGLTVFTCAPTTINTGIILAGVSEGNAAAALLLSSSTNVIGAFTTPFFLKLIMTNAKNVQIDSIGMIKSLFCIVFTPLLLSNAAKIIFSSVPRWVSANKSKLTIISSLSMGCVIWQAISRSAADIKALEFYSLLVLLATGISLHLILLLFNFILLRGVLGKKLVPNYEFKAVVISASQKALPVCVSIIAFLDSKEVGSHGLITIPCILTNCMQLFIDSYVATKLKKYYINDELVSGSATDLQTSKENCKLSQSEVGIIINTTPDSSQHFGNNPKKNIYNPIQDIFEETEPYNYGRTRENISNSAKGKVHFEIGSDDDDENNDDDATNSFQPKVARRNSLMD